MNKKQRNILVCTPLIQVAGFCFQFGYERTYAKKHIRIYGTKKQCHVTLLSSGLIEGKKYIFSLLKLFDAHAGRLNWGSEKWLLTDYARYRAFRHPNESKKGIRLSNLDRIKTVHRLYRSIEKYGCRIPPIVTENGYVVDGMHRLCIMVHLGHKKVVVNKVKYAQCFSPPVAAALARSVEILRDHLEKTPEPIEINEGWWKINEAL